MLLFMFLKIYLILILLIPMINVYHLFINLAKMLLMRVFLVLFLQIHFQIKLLIYILVILLDLSYLVLMVPHLGLLLLFLMMLNVIEKGPPSRI